MYYSILLILYLMILIPSITQLIRCADIPGMRRMFAAVGVAGVLLAPSIAWFLCDIFPSLLSMLIFLLLFWGFLKMILSWIFH